MIRILILFSTLLHFGCARHVPAQFSDEVSHQQFSTARLDQEIEEGKKTINNSKSLSSKQKIKLLKLHEKSVIETNELKQDLYRTKQILVRTLLEPKVDTKITGMVRKEIKRIEKLKTEKTLKTYEQAQKIISPVKDIKTREKLYQAFMLKGGQHY